MASHEVLKVGPPGPVASAAYTNGQPENIIPPSSAFIVYMVGETTTRRYAWNIRSAPPLTSKFNLRTGCQLFKQHCMSYEGASDVRCPMTKVLNTKSTWYPFHKFKFYTQCSQISYRNLYHGRALIWVYPSVGVKEGWSGYMGYYLWTHKQLISSVLQYSDIILCPSTSIHRSHSPDDRLSLRLWKRPCPDQGPYCAKYILCRTQ